MLIVIGPLSLIKLLTDYLCLYLYAVSGINYGLLCYRTTAGGVLAITAQLNMEIASSYKSITIETPLD